MIAFASLFLGLVVGVVPVTVIVGESVAAVEFELDGKPVGRVERKPWSLEVDLGGEFEPHKLVARAFDQKGSQTGEATQWLNLPRPPAEVEILLERDASGRANAARLTWASLTAARPTKVTLTWDRRPLGLSEAFRAILPSYDAATTHILTAELEFPSDVRSRKDVVLGGGSSGDTRSELTAIPFLVKNPKSVPPLEKLQGRFLKKGNPLPLVAVEHGPAEVCVVRDLGTEEALQQLGRSSPFAEPRLDKQNRIRIVWPVARLIVLSQQSRAELFETSRYLTAREGAFYSLLARTFYPDGNYRSRRFADAVAVAGLQAYASHSRRAVVLVTGSPRRDESLYTSEAVRRYLARVQVPLRVWSLQRPEPERETGWGEVEDISSMPRLREAVSRLKADLESQCVVWAEGRHLPQEISLAEEADGITMLTAAPGQRPEPR